MKARMILRSSPLHKIITLTACFISTDVLSYSCSNLVAPNTTTSSSGEYSITHSRNDEVIQYTLHRNSDQVASFQHSFLSPRYQKLLDDGIYAAIESTSCYENRLSAQIYAVDRDGSLIFSVVSRDLLGEEYVEQLSRTNYALGARMPWLRRIEVVGESLEDAKFVARLSNYDQLEVPLKTGRSQYIHVDLKDDADGWHARAIWYSLLGQTEEAHQHYMRALELAPENHSVRYNLMQRYSRTKEYGKALVLVEESLRLWPLTAKGLADVNPFSESVHTVGEPLHNQLWLAELRNEMGDKAEAISLLDEILAHNPYEWEASKLKANLEINEQNKGQVRESLQRVFNHHVEFIGSSSEAETVKVRFLEQISSRYANWLSGHEFYKEAEEVLLALSSKMSSEVEYPIYDSNLGRNFQALAGIAKKKGDNQSALAYLIEATNYNSWNEYLRTQIAWMYLQGDGVQVDRVEALKWFVESLSTAENPRAKYFPACYLSYINADPEAKTWCEKGVESEQADSAFWLAALLLQENSSTRVPSDLFAEVDKLLYFSKQNNYPDYRRSERIDFDIFELGDEASTFVPLLEKMALQGSIPASFHLGRLFDAGVGVEKDEQKASSWFLKAAESGDLDSQYQLGKVLLKSNTPEAIDWFKSAANAGHAWAAYDLGEIYFDGRYVPQDVEAMESWLLLSDEMMQEDYASPNSPPSLAYLSFRVGGRKSPAMRRLEKYRSTIGEEEPAR